MFCAPSLCNVDDPHDSIKGMPPKKKPRHAAAGTAASVTGGKKGAAAAAAEDAKLAEVGKSRATLEEEDWSPVPPVTVTKQAVLKEEELFAAMHSRFGRLSGGFGAFLRPGWDPKEVAFAEGSYVVAQAVAKQPKGSPTPIEEWRGAWNDGVQVPFRTAVNKNVRLRFMSGGGEDAGSFNSFVSVSRTIEV
jgi:hypothetical protein